MSRGPYLDAIDGHVKNLGITPMYMDEDQGNATWIKDIGDDNVMLIDALMKSEGWGQEKEASLNKRRKELQKLALETFALARRSNKVV